MHTHTTPDDYFASFEHAGVAEQFWLHLCFSFSLLPDISGPFGIRPSGPLSKQILCYPFLPVSFLNFSGSDIDIKATWWITPVTLSNFRRQFMAYTDKEDESKGL